MTSIIILTYNQLEYTKACIDAIIKNTYNYYEIIVVDNASQDGTADWLKEHARRITKVILNAENKGVPAGWNQGLEAANPDSDYYMMLNNDVIVSDDWLSKLINCANINEQVGAVGPLTNKISGPQLDSFYYHNAKNLHTYFWRLVGFCLLIKADVVKKVGKFDGQFGRGNYEDDDYCLRMIEAGYKNMICGDCHVHHFGSRSWQGNELNEQLQKNKKLFDAKWGDKKEALINKNNEGV